MVATGERSPARGPWFESCPSAGQRGPGGPSATGAPAVTTAKIGRNDACPSAAAESFHNAGSTGEYFAASASAGCQTIDATLPSNSLAIVSLLGGRTMTERITTLVAGGLIALPLFGVAMAGPFEDGGAAYQKGDYAAAMQSWRPLAEQGNTHAQTGLGVMYEHGQSVPQDFEQALIWYSKAADQGDPDAQSNLGTMYAKGWGVPQDYAQAVVLYRQAGERGNAGAQSNLGLMYEHGQGVPQDYISAHMWLNLAASRAMGTETRDLAAKNRDMLAAKMTPAQIAEAQRLASEWAATFESPPH